jgi:hypothetical protein
MFWMIERMTSFAVTASGSVPLIEIRIVPGFFSHTVCVATTWRSWLPPPIGTASTLHAPLVAVWESLQVISVPGWEMPSSGEITCAMPWSR